MPSSPKRPVALLAVVVLTVAVACLIWFTSRSTPTAELRPEAGDGTQPPEEATRITPAHDAATRREVESTAVPDASASEVVVTNSIRGRVVDEEGAALTDFTVHYAGRDDIYYRKLPVEDAKDGRFEVVGLKSGWWSVAALADPPEYAKSVDVFVPHEEEVLLVCRTTAVVRGTVIGPEGSPVPGAGVFDDGRPVATADAAGRYEAVGGERWVELEAQAGEMVSAELITFFIGVGRDREGIDLPLVHGGRLTVTSLDEEGGAAGKHAVYLRDPATRRQWTKFTDERGELDFGFVPPGAYSVERRGKPPVGAEVVAGETTHVVLGSPEGPRIRLLGTVTLADRPVTGVVNSYPEGTNTLRRAQRAKIDEAGRFEMGLEQAGPYLIHVGRESGRTTEFEIDVPDTASHEVHLKLPEGSLSGVLLGRGGSPSFCGLIGLVRRGNTEYLNAHAYLFAETDAKGRWSFDGLPAGTYMIEAQSNGSDSGNPAAMGSARIVDLRLGDGEAMENLRLQLEPMTFASVRALDERGRPVPEIVAFARDASGTWAALPGHSSSSPEGWQAISCLSEGAYTFMARTRDAITPESEPHFIKAYDPRDHDYPRIELHLEPGAGLKATLLDETGTPLRASFSVRDAKGREQTGTACVHDRSHVLEHGYRFDQLWLTPLLPGPYHVTATARDGRQVSGDVVLRAGVDEELVLRLE